jgi:DNA-binding NarL/FixJ family response regulator
MSSIVVIDDHDIVRFGFETLIVATPDLRLLGSAGNLADGVSLIRDRRPEIVLSDMALPDARGLDTVRAIVGAHGKKTLITSMEDESLYGEQVLALGASGYLMKSVAHACVIQAIRTVAGGGTWVSDALRARLMNRALRRHHARPVGQNEDAPDALTARELEVLDLLRGGRTTKQIASSLGLSVRTVDLHRASIKRKLGFRSGAELIAFAATRMPRP